MYKFICLTTGKSKSNLGWTPLHLAAYFGNKDVVQALVEVGVCQLSNTVADESIDYVLSLDKGMVFRQMGLQ